MSTGQWEVVGKNKKEKPLSNGKPKNKEDKRKLILENGPKLEDIMPPAQVKALYAAMEAEEEKKHGKDKKKDPEPKKQPKKPQQEKKPEPPKPKPPKSIEAAFRAIDPNELANLITSNKLRFSNAPLVWLKEAANFLNSKTPVESEDAVFSSQPVTYPLSILPAELKKPLESVIQEAGASTAQLFFDVTLTTMANDMSRGQSVVGHKVLIQMLAQENPEFCIASMQKSASLRNSYQNRPPIGLSLLWSFGQGGFKNFGLGLLVWQELILPLIELRHYSKFVITYLSRLLDRHIKMDTGKISQEQFLSMFDVIAAKRAGLPKDLSSDLIKQLVKLKKLYFPNQGAKLQVTFNQLLKKLPAQYITSNGLDPFQKELVDSLVECLHRDEPCHATWRQLFVKCNKQSATLLHYIDTNWGEMSRRLKQKPLKATLLHFKEQNVDLLTGKKKDESAVKANKLCQDILAKMTKSTRRFPWLLASFLMLFSIVGLVAYDVSRSGGSFPKSASGRLLNDLGVLEHSLKAWDKSMSTSARGYVWVEQNTPVYYARVAEFSKPYLVLTRDLCIIVVKQVCAMYGNVRAYVVDKAPVLHSTVEQYAPGLVDSVQGYAAGAWDAVSQLSVDYYKISVEYLHTKVFVGEWAPEILQDKTFKALNSTRIYVAQYYDWFHKQVHVYSKIQ